MPSRPLAVALLLAVSMLAGPASADQPEARAHHGAHHGARHVPRADLKVKRGPFTGAAGVATGTVTVVNRGQFRARASRATISVDGTVRQTLAVRPLRPGRRVRRPVSIKLAEGSHLVSACADARHAVRERREHNNCRVLAVVDVGPPASTIPDDPIPFTAGTPLRVGSAPDDYYLQVPAAYDRSHRTPARLVVFLHGCYDSADNQLASIRSAVPLDSADYLVMVPELGRDGACWDTDADPARVLAALADLETHFNIDRQRIVLGGYSSGALLTGQVALRHSADFAGILLMMGTPFTNPANRTSLLAAATTHLPLAWRAHTGDTTFPYASVTADRDALLGAGFPITFSPTSGTHVYAPADLAWLFGFADTWTSP